MDAVIYPDVAASPQWLSLLVVSSHKAIVVSGQSDKADVGLFLLDAIVRFWFRIQLIQIIHIQQRPAEGGLCCFWLVANI